MGGEIIEGDVNWAGEIDGEKGDVAIDVPKLVPDRFAIVDVSAKHDGGDGFMQISLCDGRAERAAMRSGVALVNRRRCSGEGP